MRKLRIGDTVKVITGKDKGKTGKVMAIKGDYIWVEGVNLVTKFIKPGVIKGMDKGGKIQVEGRIHRSNVMVVCPHCLSATRVGIVHDEKGKWRVCKKCGKKIDVKGHSKSASNNATKKKSVKKESKI